MVCTFERHKTNVCLLNSLWFRLQCPIIWRKQRVEQINKHKANNNLSIIHITQVNHIPHRVHRHRILQVLLVHHRMKTNLAVANRSILEKFTWFSCRFFNWLWSIWCYLGSDWSSNESTCCIEKNAQCFSVSCCCETSIQRN